MADPEIVVNGRADFSRLNRELGQTDQRIGQSSGKWGKLGKVIGGAALAGAAGVGALAAASVKLAKGAAEDEQGQVRLATALRNNTGARSADVKATEDWISAQGRAFGVTDDELRPAIARLAAATKDQVEAQKLARLGEDVAAEGTFSLTQVTKALAKARLGSVAGLAKFGIKTKESTKDTAALKTAQLAVTGAQDKYNAALKKGGPSSKDAKDAAAKLEIAQIKLGEAQKKTKTSTIDFDEAVRRLSKTFKGSAAKAADTTKGKYDRLKLTVDEIGESIGAKLLPAAGRFADFALKDLVPAADKLWTAFEENGVDGLAAQLDNLTGVNVGPYLDDLRRAGDGLFRIVKVLAPAFVDAAQSLPPFLQPLDLAADVLGGLANVAEAIPDPIKSIGVQAAVAALILPRLATATAAAGTAFLGATARVAAFSGALTRANLAGATRGVGALGGAARNAAGIGGLLALSQGAQQADEKARILTTTLGGAAVGFSLGGPIGALIGGVAGGVFGAVSGGLSDTTTATAALEQEMADSKQTVLDFAGTLSGVAGAATDATRDLAFLKLGEAKGNLLGLASQLGISNRTLVDAVLGKTSRLTELQQTLSTTEGIRGLMEKYGLTADEAADKATQLFVGLRTLGLELEDGRQAYVDQRNAIEPYSELLSSVDKQVRRPIVARFENNAPTTVTEIARLARYYKLTPKDIRTLITVSGVETSVKRVTAVRDSLTATGKTKVDLSAYRTSINRGLTEGAEAARRGGAKIRENVEKPARSTKLNLSSVAPSVRSGLVPAKNAATTGGVGIGSNTKAGFSAGFSGAGGIWSEEVRGAVRAAINAGNREAEIRSPSRKTAYTGDMMGRGLVVGLDRQKPAAKKAGRSIVAAALAGVVGGSSGITSALAKVTSLIQKQVDLKDPKKEAAREKAILSGLSKEFAALRANGRQQDQNAAQLDKARDRYRGLVQAARAYAASIKDSFVSFGSVIGLGQLEDGSVSTKSLLDQLAARLATAKRFAELIRSFRDGNGPKLNATTIQQLIDAGPEAAIATAEAIAAGGSSAVTQINDLTKEIASAGGSLGNTMVKQFKQAGITAAAGLVKGLEDRAARLDRIAVRLADKLVSRVEAQLGIGGASGAGGGSRPNTAGRIALNETTGRSNRQTVEVVVSAQALTDLQRGSRVRTEATTWTAAGGRVLA